MGNSSFPKNIINYPVIKSSNKSKKNNVLYFEFIVIFLILNACTLSC